ncbi:IS21-like element helper ATPase IstB [Burkholderia anthina]|uniref:IS21-like element helper ATPase IstB n=1 Tax=Burkholderia anthina TaxID=179879 RepID=UPI00158C1AEA|nr:IS21-like element helper ATPase IstB [Burkholderia anthina]QTD95360.1 IS21-like element helper ATPase IstB [Burkholderia anthina]QTD95530.1 IS21-like element helper ATPase IstB [Burkholderia anthina]
MLHHPTVEKLHALRLFGMAAALAEQQAQASIDQLGFEERLGLLVEREASERDSRLLSARLRRAKLRFPDAVPEDIDYRSPRGLDRTLLARLLTGEWIRERQNVILVAPTGLGKSWLACALANQACRQGHSACYLRMPKFSEEMASAHGSGRYARLLAQWARTDILVLDDLAMAPMSDQARRDLLEVLDDRHGSHSTIVTTQIPIENWHAAIGDPTLADAILDRLVHNAHRVTLAGESMRKRRNGLTSKELSE